MASTNQEKFQLEYQKLNPEQKEAVDSIEGPVMVIAGAGTGKTQTIALRIANILLQTQTPPGSILCLTFTENAATNMRQRLLSIIGETAYKVKIHTFHSFCHEIILTNPEYFIFAANIEALEELEKIEIIQDIISQLPPNSPLKPWGDPNYYQREIISRLQTLKRENITPPRLEQLIADQQYFFDQSAPIMAQISAMRAGKQLESSLLALFNQLVSIPGLSPAFQSFLGLAHRLYLQGQFDEGKAKSAAVNFKNYLLKFHQNLQKAAPKQTQLVYIYQQYQQTLLARGRYDFDDMILFVLNAFRDHAQLLSQYQERFQYVLVDEYQDTNSAQNQILRLLTSNQPQPNIFVVGDDDQSIFRFQGAAIENIFDFYQQYQSDLKLIVLKNNYRSHQLILDSSLAVINHNHQRITTLIQSLDKSLRSVSTYDPDPINIFAAPNPLSETYQVTQEVKKLITAGVSPHDIAVLYRHNSDVALLESVFQNESVPYRLETGIDVLTHPLITQLIVFMSLVQTPGDNQLIFKALASDFVHLNSVDLFKIVRFVDRQGISLYDFISSPDVVDSISHSLRPQTQRKLRNFRLRLAKALKWREIYPLDRFFNHLIRRFGILKHFLKNDDIINIAALKEFYSEIKRLTLDKNYDLAGFLKRLSILNQNHLPLTASLNFDNPGVRLMTVHKAKGLEFDYVFLIQVLDRKWGNNLVTSSLALPLGILKTELLLQAAADDNEEERRLFYVALTRAKKQIYISYPQKNDSGRDIVPSMFIGEIDPKLTQITVPDSNLATLSFKSLFPSQVPLLDSGSMRQFLTNYLLREYRFNVSHLNSYLKCPFCFYYKTILRIPAAKDKFASLGTAVHASLSQLFNQLKADNRLLSLEEFLAVFRQCLDKQRLSPRDHEETLVRGLDSLSRYYQHYHSEFSCNCLVDYDFSPSHIRLSVPTPQEPLIIPLTGKIDKVDILSTTTGGKTNARVIDFKTGNPDSKSAEIKAGSDYFRQLVFYKILADRDPQFKYHVTQGVIDFVQPSSLRQSFIRKEYQITPQDESELITQIGDVYQKIIHLDFPISPDCSDRDNLHSLTR